MCYTLREGTKGIFNSLGFAVPLLSLFLSRLLCLALYEVRGVRAARKINNYEARGDDSNAEIKVSSSKIILSVSYDTTTHSMLLLLFYSVFYYSKRFGFEILNKWC